MKSREEIFGAVRTAMVELFELEPGQVVPQAHFNNDLEIDSIDAVDLMDNLSRVFKRKVSPQDFRSVRTVQDLVDTIEKLQSR
jgi:acyl carrier protein